MPPIQLIHVINEIPEVKSQRSMVDHSFRFTWPISRFYINTYAVFYSCVINIFWDALTIIQYIPRNMHTVFALLCLVVVIRWLIFPHPSGLLHWHCGNLTIAPVPAKQPWWIWINTSCEFIMNDCITTTKQSTTKPCAYLLGYTVRTFWGSNINRNGRRHNVWSHGNPRVVIQATQPSRTYCKMSPVVCCSCQPLLWLSYLIDFGMNIRILEWI